MASIGLSIIAKDEVAVIERCLRSVMPLCDYVIVNDTGSTDGTQDAVRAFLKENGLAGEVVETPWQDFATNRTLALAEMRKRDDIDYCLMIDADEQLFYAPGFDAVRFKAGLTADWYDITTELNGVGYLRPQLTRNALPFTYRAVLHEFLVVPEGDYHSAIASGIINRPTPDGARSRNPRKYQDDAVYLWEELKREEDPFLRRRYQFYLGQSMRDGRPAIALVMERVPATLALTLPAFALKLGLGPPAGIYAALHRGGTVDRLVMAAAVAGFTVPSFVLGLVLVLVFAVQLGWLPSGGQESWRHAVLPVLTLGIGGAALLARFTRSAMLEVLGQPYVRAATARGVPWPRVVRGHALPNAAIPTVTVVGFMVGTLIAGAVVVESVFSWPGVGRLLVVSVANRDLAIVQCILLLVAGTMVLANLAVDLLYGLLDPRLRSGLGGAH